MQALSRAFALGTLVLCPTVALAAEGDAWVADYDKAVEIAKKEGKDLLVDFTGSDWCGWCIRLHNEVFQYDEFLDAAKKDYVLVALDFPRGEEAKAKVPNPDRNAAIRDKYEIQGYPTILLMTPDGEVFGRTGYMPGGAEKYVEHINELRSEGKAELSRAKELISAYEKASGEDKWAQMESILAAYEELDADSAAAGTLAKPVRDALTTDADNARGLKLRAIKALLAHGVSDEAVVKEARSMDPRNEKGLLELAVKAQVDSVASEEAVKSALKAIDELVAAGGVKDKELALDLYVNAAYWYNRFTEDTESAKKYARMAKDLEPEDERLNQVLDEILKS